MCVAGSGFLPAVCDTLQPSCVGASVCVCVWECVILPFACVCLAGAAVSLCFFFFCLITPPEKLKSSKVEARFILANTFFSLTHTNFPTLADTRFNKAQVGGQVHVKRS
eukprot:TRINITY_DN21691_c0_g1_i7.p1 TRINITY_DN21691_c0_g1~~TRINITY_DN21691_c0_g1_i7.p1  ORF type:complete len:109 (+),score=9.94 TRINITY_DN21691_c0_g1_i7:385-711(+)